MILPLVSQVSYNNENCYKWDAKKKKLTIFFICQNGFLRIKTEVSKGEKQRVYATMPEIGRE